jgi:hypothetical protein
MASVNTKTQQELEAAQATQNAQAAQNNTTAAEKPAAAANSASVNNNAAQYTTPLKGVSETTSNKLSQYSQGYQQSGSVQAAQNYLNSVMNKKPVADANLSSLYDRIMNREQFNYDLNGDALYQQYKDQYQNLGKQAMMDTMGNATALTGGYGSSYASTAGNQAYQQYLGQLNDIVPELYQNAYNRYAQEGNDLMNRYNLAYGQHRDALGDWENERNFANSDYWQKYNADYSDYQNMLNYWNNMAQMENSAYYTERDYAHSLAMAMIQKKQLPSADILAMAGMTEADAIKLGAKKPSSGGGSSKKKTSYTPTTNTDDDEEETKPTTSYMTSSRLMQMMDSAANSKYNKTSTSTENKNWLSNLFKK